jgi:phage-related protein (TIGR01555 family)
MSSKDQAGNRQNSGQFPAGQSGNKRGRPPKMSQTLGGLTLDGWANFLSGLGDAKFDKRLSNRMCVTPVTSIEAQAIYRGSDMGARLVELRVKEMWRPGFEIIVKDLKAEPTDKDLDVSLQPPVDPKAVGSLNRYGGMRTDAKEWDWKHKRWSRASKLRMDEAYAETTDDCTKLAKRAMRKFKKLKGKARFKEAQHYANAYGGGAILIGARDGQDDWSKPLLRDKVTSVDFLTSLEARELTPIAWYENPLAEKFGLPMMYQVTPIPESGAISSSAIIYVHETRLIIFDGVRVSRNMGTTHIGFGDSLFTRVKQILSDFDMGFASVGILLQEISIACMKIKGLAQSALTDDGRKKIFARMAAFAIAKSVANLSLIDADGEEFTRTNATVSGVADLLQVLMQRVAAAFDMPVTVLMGMSPAGLNATGASDIRQFYDDIAAERTDKLDEPMHNLMGLILKTLNGGIEPGDWCIEWGPLYQQNPKEQADIFLTYANADEKNVMNGFYTADEVRKSRYATGKFGTEIVIDQDDDDPNYSPEDMQDYAKAVGQDPNAPKQPPGMPVPGAKPGVGGATVGGTDIQKQAMNGAQIAAMIQVVTAVVSKTIPRESGAAILRVGLQLDPNDALDMLGPEDFEAPPPPTPPSPFGGGDKPPGAPQEGKPGVDQKPPAADKGQPVT